MGRSHRVGPEWPGTLVGGASAPIIRRSGGSRDPALRQDAPFPALPVAPSSAPTMALMRIQVFRGARRWPPRYCPMAARTPRAHGRSPRICAIAAMGRSHKELMTFQASPVGAAHGRDGSIRANTFSHSLGDIPKAQPSPVPSPESRLPPIPLLQKREHRPQALGFSAARSSRTFAVVPGVDVGVDPVDGARYEAFEIQRGGDGAGVA